MTEIKWTKVSQAVRRGEFDAVKTVIGGLEYRIYRNAKGKWKLVYGTKDVETLFEADSKVACKRHIRDVLNNPRPLAQEEVLVTYKDKRHKDGFIYRHFNDNHCKPYRVGKASKQFPNETESVRYWRMVFNLPDDVDASRVVYPEDYKVADAAPVVQEPVVYPGECPPPRPVKGVRMHAVAGECPVRLEGTKWKQVRRWAELMFQEYQQIGKFLTIGALIGAVAHEMHASKFADRQKVRNRIAAIYHEELEADRRRDELVSKLPEPETPQSRTRPEAPPKPTKPEYDRFGYKLGTRAAKINAVLDAVPKTEREIRTLIGHHANVGGHLADLVDRGFAKKVEGNKYRLARKKSNKN